MSEADYPREFALLSQDLRQAHDDICRLREDKSKLQQRIIELKEQVTALRMGWTECSEQKKELEALIKESKEQEPVGYYYKDDKSAYINNGIYIPVDGTPLFAAPVMKEKI